MLIADTAYPLQTNTLRLAEGTTLAYSDTGQGFPLLFIHGLGSYIPAWLKTISFFQPQYRCLALDLPGYGKSTKAGIKPGMEYYADVICDFLDKMQLPECYLVGHSMGGQVGMHTALKYSDRIKKLALIAPAGIERFSPAEGEQLKSWFEPEKVFRAGPELIVHNVKANFYRFPEDAQPLLNDRLHYRLCNDYQEFCQVISASVSAMLQEPVYERLPELQMPVWVVFGRQDAYIPSSLIHPDTELEKMVRQAVSFMPDGYCQFFDACGHFVQWEKPAELNQHLAKFLGKSS